MEPGDPAEVHCPGIKQEMEGTLPDDVTANLQGPPIGAIKIEADVDKLDYYKSNHYCTLPDDVTTNLQGPSIGTIKIEADVDKLEYNESNHSSTLPSLEQSDDLISSFQTPGTYHCSDSDPQSSHGVKKWVVESSAILPQRNHMENYECGQLGVINTPRLKEKFSDKDGLGNSFVDLDAASVDQNVHTESITNVKLSLETDITNVKPSMETDTVMPVSGDTVTSGFSYHHETMQRQVRETSGKRGTSIKYILRKTGDGEMVYQCPVCGKLYGYLSSLATHHKRIHMGPKPYKCCSCGKEFYRHEHLKQHQHTHRGEEPFKCSVCGKGFTREDHLNRHRPIHSGDKPYKCLVCDREFSQLDHLSRHKSIHGKDKP